MKLDEAAFFLGHMREHRIPRAGHVYDYLYFASAFLTATVSVVYILEALAGERFKAWYRRWQEALTVEDRREWASLFWWLGGSEQRSTAWVFDDEGGNRADIFETCQRYFTLVTRLLRDFEAHALPRD